MTILTTNQIRDILPHRYPFLMIDKVTEHVPGKTLKAIKNVTVNEPCFQGHFPKKPIFPGVLIVEAMAQAAALMGELSGTEALSGVPSQRTDDGEVLYYLVGVDKARFRRLVEPGDQLVIDVEFITVRRNIWRFSATGSVDGREVASAELLTTIADPES
ncbi:MAG: 3-hydroxyacyl-ACP dehydratase FabZ [Gammaproteobacteria bacterium]